MPTIQHKKLNVTAELKDFSQAQYEEYHASILELTKGIGTSANSNAAVVRSAIKAGFLVGVKADDIAGMSPAAVKWLLLKVSAHVEAITTPPKDDVDDPNS